MQVNSYAERMWRTLFGTLTGAGALIAAALIGGCEVAHPFRGPAFDRERGAVNLDPDRVLLVALTRGDVAADGGNGFGPALRDVLDGMDAHDGLVGYSVRRQLLGPRVWTMSVWTDRESLEKFLASPAHRAAVRNGGIPGEAVISAYLEVPAGQVPIPWARAKSVLAEAAQQEVTR